ncbi:MAG: bifunctional phosphoribosyl-AMP cyclohydrolase/phosphoribosyl-ATP diphosphatase HisIE [Acidobacteriota bacterium]|nr:bifunctional phosphoribosyl-AMP cyclohydrolase/phosphoribosyl-ATP diphosphatase HisIE [Acidobacteriota bacterium]
MTYEMDGLIMDVKKLDWEKMNGLIPAIVQDSGSGRVLMLGFMSPEALEKTLESRLVTFWSRSRKTLWTKGTTSGNYLKLQKISYDCDADTILVVVNPEGPCCHRGTLSCFTPDNEFVGLEFLGYLERLIADRRSEMSSNSYTAKLFTDGISQIAKKVGEEAVEVILSASEERQRSIEETGDLIYHLLVFLNEREVTWKEVMEELQSRHLKDQHPRD